MQDIFAQVILSRYLRLMKYDELAFFNQQLAGMLKSGIPLEGALRQLCLTMEQGRLRQEFEQLGADLAKGVSLPEALARRRLPEFYVKMVQAGAQSNDLPGMLTLLANYYQKLNNIWVRLKGLMVYPAIVLAGMLALSLLFMFLIGSLSEGVPGLVEGWSQGWAFQTKFTVALWLPAIVLTAVAVAVLLAFFVPACRRSLRWRLPGFKEAGLSQVASMTGLMLESGTNLNSALGLLKDIESGTPAGAEIARWQTRLAGGHAKFAEMTSGSRVFPPLFCWLVAGGGENLAEGFRRAAEIYYARALYRIEMLLYVALPASVLMLGMMIFCQLYPVVQMFIPMANMLDMLGGS